MDRKSGGTVGGWWDPPHRLDKSPPPMKFKISGGGGSPPTKCTIFWNADANFLSILQNTSFLNIYHPIFQNFSKFFPGSIFVKLPKQICHFDTFFALDLKSPHYSSAVPRGYAFSSAQEFYDFWKIVPLLYSWPPKVLLEYWKLHLLRSLQGYFPIFPDFFHFWEGKT